VAKAQAQEAAIQKKENERHLRELEAQRAKEAAIAFEEEERLLAQARNEISKVAATDRVSDKKTAEEIALRDALKEASKKTADAISTRVEEAPAKFPTSREAASSLEEDSEAQAPLAPVSAPSLEVPLASAAETEEAETIGKPSVSAAQEVSEIPLAASEALRQAIPPITPQTKAPEGEASLLAEAPVAPTEEPKPEETKIEGPQIPEPISPSALARGKVLFVWDKAERAVPSPEDKPVLYFSSIKNVRPGEAAPAGAKRVSLNPFPNGISIKNSAKAVSNPIVTPKEEPKVVMAFAVKKEEPKPALKALGVPSANPPLKKGLFVASAKPKAEPAPQAAAPSPKKIFMARNDEEKRK
jgi:hypothetical protein